MTQTIVVTEFLSLDGVMQAPNEWNIPYVDETLGADIQGELDRATALLYALAGTIREALANGPTPVVPDHIAALFTYLYPADKVADAIADATATPH